MACFSSCNLLNAYDSTNILGRVVDTYGDLSGRVCYGDDVEEKIRKVLLVDGPDIC